MLIVGMNTWPRSLSVTFGRQKMCSSCEHPILQCTWRAYFADLQNLLQTERVKEMTCTQTSKDYACVHQQYLN